MKLDRSVVALLALVLVALPSVADWPHLCGPGVDGRVAAPGTCESEDIGLALSWRIPLGAPYSGIAVSGGRAVTMFADTEADWVTAFNTKTGREIRRHRLGELNRGHDGSGDGPLSSPIIGNGHVFAFRAQQCTRRGCTTVSNRIASAVADRIRQLQRLVAPPQSCALGTHHKIDVAIEDVE